MIPYNVPSKFKGPLVKSKTSRLTRADKYMIRQIQGDIHVGKSDMYVARYWLKRASYVPLGYGPYKGHKSKLIRFAIVREGLKCHHDNQGIYRYVTGSI